MPFLADKKASTRHEKKHRMFFTPRCRYPVESSLAWISPVVARRTHGANKSPMRKQGLSKEHMTVHTIFRIYFHHCKPNWNSHPLGSGAEAPQVSLVWYTTNLGKHAKPSQTVGWLSMPLGVRPNGLHDPKVRVPTSSMGRRSSGNLLCTQGVSEFDPFQRRVHIGSWWPSNMHKGATVTLFKGEDGLP